jgi:branched-chain amino acid transport system ATP-binding protein
MAAEPVIASPALDMAASLRAAAVATPDRAKGTADARSLPLPQRVLMALDGVHTAIGRQDILKDVGFDVPGGGVTLLLGRKGVGKTTALRTIMGLSPPRAGSVMFAGNRIDGWSAHRIARLGVGYVPEKMGIFSTLNVAENIALGALSQRAAASRIDWLMQIFPPLARFWRVPAGSLSGGQKQMLSLARAFVEKRRLYVIDEPTKGLEPAMVSTVVSALRDLKLQGATILMVEQNFAVARALADTCVLMDQGRVTWRGPMADFARDAVVQHDFNGPAGDAT